MNCRWLAVTFERVNVSVDGWREISGKRSRSTHFGADWWEIERKKKERKKENDINDMHVSFGGLPSQVIYYALLLTIFRLMWGVYFYYATYWLIYFSLYFPSLSTTSDKPRCRLRWWLHCLWWTLHRQRPLWRPTSSLSAIEATTNQPRFNLDLGQKSHKKDPLISISWFSNFIKSQASVTLTKLTMSWI